jgi:hypothetical protein
MPYPVLTVHDLYSEVRAHAEPNVQSAGALKYVVVSIYASNKLGQGDTTFFLPSDEETPPGAIFEN